MRNCFTKLAFALALLSTVLLPNMAVGQPTAPAKSVDKYQQIATFLKEAELMDSLAAYWQMVAGMTTSEPQLKRLKAGTSMDKGEQYLIEFLLKHYNQRLFQESTGWFKSPKVQKFYSMANAPLSNDSSKVQVPAKRRELILRILNATGTKDMASATYRLSSMGLAMLNGLPPGNADFLTQLTYSRDQTALEQSTFDNMARRFKDVPDEELAELAIIFEMPESKWATGMVRGALLAAIYNMTADVTRASAGDPTGGSILDYKKPQPGISPDSSGLDPGSDNQGQKPAEELD